MAGDEWEGDVHVLTVHAVHPPESEFDDGDLDCDITHPPTCRQEDRGCDGVTVMTWTCDVAETAGDVGLAFSLRYSGTPVTRPGTYRIRAWGRRYRTEAGYEYDGGTVLVTEAGESPAGTRECRHCGGPVVRCEHPGTNGLNYPLCRGWRHAGYDSQPVIGHCCEGRLVNPVAEPREDESHGADR